MAKRMLADVLWEAANKRLSAPRASSLAIGTHRESCCAVLRVVKPRWTESERGFYDYASDEPALLFLRKLGCNPHTYFFYHEFEEEDRQGARYMWLLLAMHVAEDEGIEVDV